LNWLDRIRSPLLIIGGLALIASASTAFVFGEFGTVPRLALALAILCIGGYIAIDPGKALGDITRRESVYGSNATVLTIAFLGILVLANVLGNRFHQRWDITAQNDYSLSDATVRQLQNLPAPVFARAFFSGSLSDKSKAELLLKEYESKSGGKLTYEMIDTNADPARANLERINVDGTIRFKMGDKQQDTITPDEAHMTTALMKLVDPTPVKVYFITGHGERSLDQFNDDGYSELKTQVQNENFVLENLNLLSVPKIPDDAAAIMIAAPKTPFLPAELDIVKQYLDAKGRLVLFVDPQQDQANMQEILQRWDLTIGKGVVVDPVSALQGSPLTTIVQRFNNQHAIGRDQGTVAIMPFTTTIEIPQAIKRTLDINGLAFTMDSRSWLETDTETLRYDEGVDKKGPLTMAVAVEEAENAPPSDQDQMPGFQDPNKRVKNRAVIFGTSEMGINGLIKLPYGNRDFIVNSLNWVTQRDQLITTRPRIEERRTVFLSNQESAFVLVSSAFLIPALLVLGAVTVWWKRR